MNGREGLQAARAADFTLPRFAFLVPLCLVHGRYSLHRTAFIAKFAFYKSIFLCSLQVRGWLWAVGCGLWAVGCGLWAVGCGLWAVVCGLWAVGCGLWAVGCGLWAVDVGCGLWMWVEEQGLAYRVLYILHVPQVCQHINSIAWGVG